MDTHTGNIKAAVPKIGLALGGGGARGLAHVGVLKVLDREGIPISHVAGTSMGGIIGAMFAAGLPVSEIEKAALGLRKPLKQISLIDFNLIGKGLLRGTRLYRWLASYLGQELTFADLHIPLAMMAVDLNSGREVVLWQGKVVDAIRATISVPGVFEPVKRDDLLLADGGILNNVPVDTVRNLGAQAVIAVDVLPSFTANLPGQPPAVHPLKTPFLTQTLQDVNHAFMLMISEITACRLRHAPPDIIIRPPLPADTHLFIGFDRPAELIAVGEAATEQALPQIRALLAQSGNSQETGAKT